MVPVRRSGISSRCVSRGWRDPLWPLPLPRQLQHKALRLEGGTCSCSESAHARPHEGSAASWLTHSPDAATSSNEEKRLHHVADEVVKGQEATMSLAAWELAGGRSWKPKCCWGCKSWAPNMPAGWCELNLHLTYYTNLELKLSI